MTERPISNCWLENNWHCSGLDWRWNTEDRLHSCAASSCPSTHTDLTWPRGGNSSPRWTCNVTVTCLYQRHLQLYCRFREKCLPCPCSKQDRWKSVWPRSHVAPGTTLCVTECALQLKSTSVVPPRGNLASDPNCTGHDCSGSRLKYSGEEADLQKSITAKAGDRPGKLKCLETDMWLLRNVSYSQALPNSLQHWQYTALYITQEHIFLWIF